MTWKSERRPTGAADLIAGEIVPYFEDDDKDQIDDETTRQSCSAFGMVCPWHY
jgi:hypothetical protein